MDLIAADGTVIGTAPAPIAVVSDNGPCCRARHSPRPSPTTTRCCDMCEPGRGFRRPTACVERFVGTLKYEHLY